MDKLKKYSPQYVHVNDTVAFVAHLSFLQEDCKLVGLTEEQYLDDLGSIPQGWNRSSQIYQFRYVLKSADSAAAADKPNDKEEAKENDNAKSKSSILVKILSMDKNALLITAVRQGSNDVVTLELNLNDHIDTLKASKDLNDYASVYRDIDALLVLLYDQITSKVMPKPKAKADVKSEKDKKKPSQDPYSFPEPNPHNPLLIGGGRRPAGGVPFGGGFGGDMDPFGGGGGNLMGPNQINRQWQNRNNPNANKPPFVPPNARFDPYGPGGQFPGGPNPDHFRPPRSGGGGGGGFGGFGGII